MYERPTSDPANLRRPRPAARLALEASSDLGGGAWRTLRSVVLPLTLPAVAAGSIFTFSLALDDLVAVNIVAARHR